MRGSWLQKGRKVSAALSALLALELARSKRRYVAGLKMSIFLPDSIPYAMQRSISLI